MTFYVIALLGLIVAALVWLWNDVIKYRRYPRGPLRFPLLGNLPQLALQKGRPTMAIQSLAEKYGDVMFLQMGMVDIVMISSFEAASELFGSDAFLQKHLIDYTRDRNMDGNYGIILSSGPIWQTFRRFTIRTLRDFGFGKSASMDSSINEGLQPFEDHLRSLMTSQNGVVRVENIFQLPVVNVLWKLVTGKTYGLDDARMKYLLQLSNDLIDSVHLQHISQAYPLLRHWFPNWSGRNHQLNCIHKITTFFKGIIKEHKDSGAYVTNPECFIDVFLAKIADGDRIGESYYNEDQLLYTLLDLFQAGSETTSNTLEFAVLYMILYPEVQERVQREIDTQLEKGEELTSAIKLRLPYTMATILETIRYSSVIPLLAPRELTEDLYIQGTLIPKGAPIVINVEAIHFQKSIWGDPHQFRPDRFLTPRGDAINLKMVDYIEAFGGGKRICLGKNLAENTLFIYFVSLMKQFKFSTVEGQPKPKIEPRIRDSHCPHPFDVHITPRFV